MNFGVTLSNRGVLLGLTTPRDLLTLADAVEASPHMDSVWCGDALFVNRQARCADAARGGGGTHRARADRAGLHGLVRAAQSAGVRLRMGVARRAVERPHALGRLRRRRRGSAVGGGDGGARHRARRAAQADDGEHPRAAASVDHGQRAVHGRVHHVRQRHAGAQASAEPVPDLARHQRRAAVARPGQLGRLGAWRSPVSASRPMAG